MIDILNSVCFGVAFLIVWFHTEAFIEYGKLFGLAKLLKINEFESALNNDFTLEYLPWLRATYPNFVTKLISCSWCIGFWFTLTVSLFFYTIYIFPVIYVLTHVIYLKIVKAFFR